MRLPPATHRETQLKIYENLNERNHVGEYAPFLYVSANVDSFPGPGRFPCRQRAEPTKVIVQTFLDKL